MAKLIKKSRKGYTNISNVLVRDSELTWKARGIFLYLWSQADNWNFYVSEIAKHATDGEGALKSGLKELEEFGYLIRKHSQSSDGSFNGMLWILNDDPDHQGKNTIDGEINENHRKNVKNPSDGKPIGWENHRMDNQPLRTNNNKNYQYKELPTKRKNSQAEPDKGTTHLAERKEIIGYLNNKLGTNYRSGAKKNKERMNARLNEGYTVDDFKRVIDNKYTDWADSPKMARYLRPETLFSPKFESYLNEKQMTANDSQGERDYAAELEEWNRGD